MEPFSLPSRNGLKTGCEKELINLIREIEWVLSRRKEECDEKLALTESRIESYADQLRKMNDSVKLAQEQADSLREMSWKMEETYRHQVAQLKEEIAQLKNDYKTTNKGFEDEMSKKNTKDSLAILGLRKERTQLQDEVDALRAQLEARKDSRRSQLIKVTKALQEAEKDLKEKEKRIKELEEDRKKGTERLAERISEVFLEREEEHRENLKSSILKKIRKVEEQFQL